MSYQGYVMAAYLVFAVVLAWDFLVPHLQVRQALRAARRRAARQARPATRAPLPTPSNPELPR